MPDVLADPDEVAMSLELAEQLRDQLAGGVRDATDSDAAGVQRRAEELLTRAGLNLPAAVAARITTRAARSVCGCGPVDECLADDAVNEVMINGPDDVRVERDGSIFHTGLRFAGSDDLERTIDRMLARAGRRADRRNPIADARLPDGSRVHVVLPPVAVNGPYLTVRRFQARVRTRDDLAATGAATSEHLRAMRELVDERANVLISGGTGSGKTTWLAALLQSVDPAERIVVMEDALELPLEHPHAIRLEARPETLGGGGDVSIRDLLRASLRMRPDRLVVGEVRGPEAFDLIQALHTGHRGCWGTVHANGPAEVIPRLATLASLAEPGSTPDRLAAQAAEAIDAVIHLERVGGVRRVVAVDRVGGMPGHARSA